MMDPYHGENPREILEKLSLRQFMIPMVNDAVKWTAPDHCGVIYSDEYRRGVYRVHLGNMFAGIAPDAETRTYESLDELLDVWRID
jgi:hypothetical protein